MKRREPHKSLPRRLARTAAIRHEAALCLGILSHYRRDAIVTRLIESMQRIKGDEDERAFVPFMNAAVRKRGTGVGGRGREGRGGGTGCQCARQIRTCTFLSKEWGGGGKD